MTAALAVRTDSAYLIELHERATRSIDTLAGLVRRLPDGSWKADTMRLRRQLTEHRLFLEYVLERRPDVEREP